MPTLAKIVPFLWYAKEAEEAASMGFRGVNQGRSAIRKESAKVTLNPSLQQARPQHLAT